eukprot:2326658-Rhodomonas_salina.1
MQAARATLTASSAPATTTIRFSSARENQIEAATSPAQFAHECGCSRMMLCCAVLCTVLRARYAVSGTGIAYDATRAVRHVRH